MAVLALSGCSSKKDKARIRDLEAEIESIHEEDNNTLSERERELAQHDDDARTAQNEAAQTIQQLTRERDTAVAEVGSLKKAVERAEAARVASVPKDASSPGHPDFNPAKAPKITQAIATITGDVSSGTGFVVAVDDKRFLYTAAQILKGNTHLTIANSAGRKFVKFGAFEFAEGTPFVRMELLDAADAPALQLAAVSSQATAASGSSSSTSVAALGVNPATGTVTAESGSFYAQNEDAIEVEATLIQGKSGGPLIATATGQVIALIINSAAEHTDLWSATAGTAAAAATPPAGLAAVELPYRACRLNRNLQWQAVPIVTFLAEAKRIADYDGITRVALALAALRPTASGLGVDVTLPNGQTALAILSAAKDFPIAADAITLHTQVATKKIRFGDAELKKRFGSVISFALTQMQRGAVGFEPAKFNPCHRRYVENSIKWRKDANQRLQSIVGTTGTE